MNNVSALQLQLGPHQGNSIVVELDGSSQSYFLNALITILGRKKMAGLCGTPDGDSTNEWKDRNTGYYWAMNSIDVPMQVSESWRYVLTASTALTCKRT